MLQKIVQYKKEELSDIKFRVPLSEIKSRIKDNKESRNFSGAIVRAGSDPEKIRIIGEIKKASPSAGVIREKFDPAGIAGAYEVNGISAISVLTDKHFFQGDIAYLPLIKNTVTVPVLRKDFIFDEYQIYESAAYQADAILLIASLLEKNQLIDYFYLCNDLRLHSLIEIHNFKDMEKVLSAGNIFPVIGINNRDLKTFVVDTKTTVELIGELPEDTIIVSESGIKNRDDIAALIKAGVHAFLIGETFMREKDIGKKVREFIKG